ncbi:hypothetical protein PGT21_012632 [Puccinia graminis f. sp. tritici]|uniref:DUF6589 domain-containing protein n=1 Tax=Puccinia graminis f. sp. tritici TaxID=56615 RepID=A0A5B0R0D2_PUCGR|nr:hypothetical protein PGT21_012632 [Puccinia graminis f. sp. tritici]
MPVTSTLNWTPPARPKKERDKIQLICDLIAAMDLTPKSFLTAFLQNPDMSAAYQRRYWSTKTGVDGTILLVKVIRDTVQETEIGEKKWNDFILNEASIIVQTQTPPNGVFPKGRFYSSKAIKTDFFDSDAKDLRDRELIEEHMPFLFKLVTNKMRLDLTPPSNAEDSDDEDSPLDDSEAQEPDLFGDGPDAFRDHRERVVTTGKTICAMVAFLANRRHNGLQISNALTFLPCGVTERVNKYLQQIGLTSSRKTALSALKTLGRAAESNISKKIGNKSKELIAPFICIDNLDFEQTVHTKSLGHESTTFHGTWGYIHQIDRSFISSLPQDGLTLQAFKESMTSASSVEIHPKSLYGSISEHLHWKQVLKSQIATVLLKYLVKPTDKKIPITTTPPTVDQISHSRPNITMLKLMVASDNSSQGVSEVFDGILQQSSISDEDFYNRLQVIDGDLGTCTNIQSLRNIRIPNRRNEENLSSILTLLGGAHTLWNIASAIFSLHIGNSADRRDSGAWRFLDSMGIPSDKPVNKKDFTLMIQSMEKIHEATICHFLMIVMGIENTEVSPQLQELPSDKIDLIINECYNRFFTASAVDQAGKNLSPKLLNQILRTIDFASVVEANRSMKSGDIGRVMYMWKRWSVMSQSMKKLKNYSIQLPRMILLLEKILPSALSKVILHSLLIAPSGRRKHFVAKDFYLEVQNYWLKYFFNHTGKGTDINRLKDVFSVNVALVCFLFNLIGYTFLF